MINTIMYHYVRNNEEYDYDCYCRRITEFESQVDFLRKRSDIIDPKDIDKVNYFLKNDSVSGYILSFDDGYKDHLYCAKYLESIDSNGVFFPSLVSTNGDLLEVNGIHILIGLRNIKQSEILDFVIQAVKDNDFLIKKNGEVINIDDYFSIEHENRHDKNNSVIFIKRLLQKDIVGLENRKKIINEGLNTFYNQKENDIARNLYLSKVELIKMREMGMLIGSHGLTHRWLNTLSYEEQFNEIVNSFIEFEKLNIYISGLPKVFCYPYGVYDENTLKICNEARISYSFTDDLNNCGITIKDKSHSNYMYQLSRWDTNDYWNSEWRRPKQHNAKF